MLHTPTQYFTYDYTLNILRSILDTGTLERRLQDPGVCCGSAEIGGIKRETCCYPYRCCSRYIPPWGLNKHGSPLSRASPGASPEWRLPPDSHAEQKAEDKDEDKDEDKEDARATVPPTPRRSARRRSADWKRRLPPWDRFK